ncbi:SRPBCC family protein [Streptomyces sp. NPDC048297]|uniref:SRPBCC family protein n=1 Tax=Streptomyces sp. NPDC048297 TaxID=3365531 RepID=UPI003720C8CD
MELHHEFTVPVPVDDAWHALLDIERVAPCLPGATVQEYDGKTVTGSVKVKLGPVTLTYRGTAVFEEQDETAHRMVLLANGREARGQGTARATVTGTLSERDGGTAVSVRTDLTVTGRPAQFGRGVLAEVGDRLVGQFAACLEQRLTERPAQAPETGRGEGQGEGEERAQPSPLRTEHPEEPEGREKTEGREETGGWEETEGWEEAEPLDLLRTAGLPVAKRVAGAAAVVTVLAVVVARLRRRRRARRTGRSRR